jgi:dipeptidyl aminopeptidase/acylaminoacyl peptidase
VVTDAWDRSISGLVWLPDSKALLGAIDDAAHQRIWRIEVPSGKATPVTEKHSFSGLALSDVGSTLVALRQSFVEPPTLVRVDTATGAATKLSTFNDERLAALDLGTYESVTYRGANDEPVQMWINYPPGFDRSKRWPVYLLLHGGPHNGITDSFHWRWSAQLFSGWGYVTAWHNFHGSSGFGQSFTDSINPEQSELPYEDTILAWRRSCSAASTRSARSSRTPRCTTGSRSTGPTTVRSNAGTVSSGTTRRCFGPHRRTSARGTSTRRRSSCTASSTTACH